MYFNYLQLQNQGLTQKFQSLTIYTAKLVIKKTTLTLNLYQNINGEYSILKILISYYYYKQFILTNCQVNLPEWWSVISNDNQLGFALAKGLQCLLVAKHIFATLHHKSQTRIDILNALFLK